MVCSFCPRPFDFDPRAVPVPYNHSNVMSDEVIYYASSEFMSRKGIEYGSVTLHPDGVPHGPHPGRDGAVARAEGDQRAGGDGRHVPHAEGEPPGARRSKIRITSSRGSRRRDRIRRAEPVSERARAARRADRLRGPVSARRARHGGRRAAATRPTGAGRTRGCSAASSCRPRASTSSSRPRRRVCRRAPAPADLLASQRARHRRSRGRRGDDRGVQRRRTTASRDRYAGDEVRSRGRRVDRDAARRRRSGSR